MQFILIGMKDGKETVLGRRISAPDIGLKIHEHCLDYDEFVVTLDTLP